MNQMVACPDCGTPNRPDAELCVQCWRGMNELLASRIPATAFAVAAGTPAPPPPPAAPPPRPVAQAPRPAPQATFTIEPSKPREAEPGPVPYFAPVGACVSPNVAVPVPVGPLTGSTSSARAFPWGTLVTIGVLLALLAGGYLFLFDKPAAFSPDNGSYSVVLPEGWVPVDEVEAALPQIDAAVRSENNQSAIMVGHWPLPVPVTKEQFQAGMPFAQQFMPRLPGVTMGSFQESTAVAGEGVSAFEMTATATAGLVPGGQGKMRAVVVFEEGSTSFVLLVVACASAECPAAEATFAEMTPTFEFSG